MHGYKRTDRINASIRETVSLSLIKEAKDPRLQGVTITRVEVTPDLQLARVFYRTLEDQSAEQLQMIEKGLNRAAGFLRRRLGEDLVVKRVPRLAFAHDADIDAVHRIEKLIEDIHQEEPQE